MRTQCIDTGVSRTSLERYLEKVGYWDSSEKRIRHAFVLSPSVFVVSAEQHAHLRELGRTTYAAVRNLSTTLYSLGSAKSLTHKEAAFLRLSKHGSRKLLLPRDGDARIPPALKVDLVQDPDGRMHIAEVDVYNPRGFGFFAFLDQSVPEGMQLSGPGIMGLAKAMLAAQASDDVTWVLLVSEFERYYETTFRILADTLGREGIKARVVRECELAENYNPEEIMHLFAIPESLFAFPRLREGLVAAYRAGSLITLYPPTAYLGSKAFLPYLATQEGMSEFVPACELVGKHEQKNGVSLDHPTVLKAAVSSGLKKVIFSDLEAERFRVTYAEAQSLKVPVWVLQQQVPQEPIPIVVFDDEGNRVTRDYFLRITAYVTKNGMLGAEVTGRTDRMVHGAKDCIQIPCVLA